jgi:hypothetical protein
MYLRRVARWLLCLSPLVGQPTIIAAQANPPAASCDTTVKARPSDPLSYRRRSDRCEGVYAQNVSGSSSLLVASLTESFEEIDASYSHPLRVDFSAPEEAYVSLRARSVKPGVFYRMETIAPTPTTPYLWPPGVLRALRLRSTDIGIIGSTLMPVGGVRQEVLVPVRIGHLFAAARTTAYRVTVWPSVELSDAYLTLATVGADGKPAKYLQRDESLGYGFYPAQRGVVIRLKPLDARGVYLVRIAAKLKRGGSATTSFLLFHPGPLP